MQKNLLRKGLVIGIIIILFIGLAVIPSTGISNIKKITHIQSNSNTLYVGGSEPGNYSKIQDAIDNASSGDTVFVFDDSSPYFENIVIIKPIYLMGEDKQTTVIDGNYNIRSVVDIREDGVTVSGFKIINCWYYSIILRRCGNAVIKGNIISIGIENEYSDPFGVYLLKSKNNLIQENKIFNSKGLGDGISCYASAKESYSNNISGNEIFGFKWGINVENYEDVILFKNYIYNNSHLGIRLKNSANTLISGNIVKENGYNKPRGGIILDKSENITVINNYLSNNNRDGVFLYQSDNNKIHQNDFIDNERNANFFESSLNSWNKNYWNKPRIFPKLIFRKINFGDYSFPWFNIDWRPAKEPYDINGVNEEYYESSYEDPLTFRVEFERIFDRVWKINGYATNTFDEEITVRWGCPPCTFAFFYPVPDEDLNLLIGQYRTPFYTLKFYNKWFEFKPGEEKLIDSKLFIGISNHFTYGLSKGYQQYFDSWPILPNGEYEVRASLSPYQNENYEMLSLGVQQTIIFNYT